MIEHLNVPAVASGVAYLAGAVVYGWMITDAAYEDGERRPVWRLLALAAVWLPILVLLLVVVSLPPPRDGGARRPAAVAQSRAVAI